MKSGISDSASSDQARTPGKRRTWWHRLPVRLLNHLMATAYEVLDEVLVGRMPLRVDSLLIRREQGRLSAAAARDLGPLVSLLNRFTLVEFKDFATQYAETEYLGEWTEDLTTAVLELIPPEKRLRGLSPEDRLRGLSDEKLDRLRELLER